MPTLSEHILSRLGLKAGFRYEKYRTEFKRAGEKGVATLDETPIGVYLELEGAPSWIDRTAKRMGFQESDYILTSYYGLYVAYCRDQGFAPTNMTFETTPSSSALRPAGPASASR